MSAAQVASFEQADLLERLEALDEAGLDGLDFGVIGFDERTLVRRYNARESRSSLLAPHDVLGKPLFTEIAQCMNNYLVAQHFLDAAAGGLPLDTSLDFVFTWRLRPTKVRLRLLWAPGHAMRYVAVSWPA